MQIQKPAFIATVKNGKTFPKQMKISYLSLLIKELISPSLKTRALYLHTLQRFSISTWFHSLVVVEETGLSRRTVRFLFWRINVSVIVSWCYYSWQTSSLLQVRENDSLFSSRRSFIASKRLTDQGICGRITPQ